MPKKDFEKFKIISIDGSHLIEKQDYVIRDEKGKLKYEAFKGYLDASLDTYKLEEVYNKHKGEFKEKFYFFDDEHSDPYTLALINVSFDYAKKNYDKRKSKVGNLFVLNDPEVNLECVKANLKDHVCLVTKASGEIVLAGIEVPFANSKDYLPVQEPVNEELLGNYFIYDDREKCYYQNEKKKFKTQIDIKSIRNQLYRDGFDCDGVHYVRYKRSAGSSRDGQCLFIPDVLYDEMMEWSCCGIDGNNIKDQASFQAYISLTLSSVEKRIKLSKKSIVIIPDQTSEFDDDVVLITEDNAALNAVRKTAKISNKIWDGEGLLDESVFIENGIGDKGMMLLRNRFFKTCAFNTKLQKWFKDNGITDISQLSGCHRKGAKLQDVKLIITESSLKYCKMLPKDVKLQDKFDAWLDNAFEGNSSYFGLVKTEKPTAFMGGRMVRTNYQLLNTLGLDKKQTDEVLAQSFDYLSKIMKDPAYLRHYIKLIVSSDEYEEQNQESVFNYRAKVVFKMLKHTDKFAHTQFYSDFRGDVVTAFKRKIKQGRIQVNGTYATLFGNGAEFLKAVIDKNFRATDPIALKGNEIRTTQFDYDKELLCARSPHITMGNLLVAKNVDNDVYKEYFNFEKAHEIVCVNAIKHNLQHRLNGCDYDSDTMLLTDQPVLLQAAKRDAVHFHVPVGSFKNDNVEYYFNDSESIAGLDNVISNNRIGVIVNLSQFLNSLYWDRIASGESHDDCADLYNDICKLAVLSGVEIDKAKRASVSEPTTASTIAQLQQKYKSSFINAQKNGNGDSDNTQYLPAFYVYLTTGRSVKTNVELKCAMSWIYRAVAEYKNYCARIKKINLMDLVDISDGTTSGNNDYHYKKEILDGVKAINDEMNKCSIRMRGYGRGESRSQKDELDRYFAQAKALVKQKLKNDHVLELLLKELDEAKRKDSDVKSYGALLFSLLVFEENQRFINLLKLGSDPVDNLVFDPTAESTHAIYGYPHKRQASANVLNDDE